MLLCVARYEILKREFIRIEAIYLNLRMELKSILNLEDGFKEAIEFFESDGVRRYNSS